MGAVTGPKPHVLFDSNFDMQVGFYTERAEFHVPVKVAADAPAGRQTLVVATRYQSCNDTLCLPPKTVRLHVFVDIRAR
jgi:hypothetical protein